MVEINLKALARSENAEVNAMVVVLGGNAEAIALSWPLRFVAAGEKVKSEREE